jgi:menaquinone-dependent protoporphyrinogen oxidase
MAVLVAYATRHGSTREVAEEIAATLQALGANVELREAGDVRGPEGFVRGLPGSWSLVVLGAPLCSGRWHRDAHRFLRRHRKDLAGVPVAVFGLGPRSAGKPGGGERSADKQAWQRSRAQLDRAVAKHTWLTPTAAEVFGGDPPGKQPRRDLRDWARIEAWAASIASPADWLREMAL